MDFTNGGGETASSKTKSISSKLEPTVETKETSEKGSETRKKKVSKAFKTKPEKPVSKPIFKTSQQKAL